MNNPQRLFDFPGADHQPCAHVSTFFDWHLEADPLVRVRRMISPKIGIDSGCARSHSDDAEIPPGLIRECPSAVHAIGEGACIDEHGNQIIEFLFEPVKVRTKDFTAVDAEVLRHSSEGNRPAQEAASEQLAVQPHESFTQCLRTTCRNSERHVCRERTDVGRVVVDAFQLQQEHAQCACTRRNRHIGQPFDGVRVGQRVANARITGYGLGQKQSVRPREPLESFLRAFVNVEQSELQVQDGFASDAETKVPGFNHARVYGPDRDLKHPFSLDLPEGVRLSGRSRNDGVAGEILPEREDAFRPVVVQRDPHRVRVPLRDQPEKIHHFTFEPIGRRVLRRDRLKRGLYRIHRGDDAQERALTWKRPDVVDEELARDAAVVRSKERHQPSAQIAHNAARKRGNRRRFRLEHEFARTDLADGPVDKVQRR